MACVTDYRLFAIDATLDALPLHHFEGQDTHLGGDVVQSFEQFPRCPGIIVVNHHQFCGIIGRIQFLEWMLSSHVDVLSTPLALLRRMQQTPPLILPISMPIQDAAQQLLTRSPLNDDPIVVQIDAQTYRLLDRQVLLRAAWQIKEMAIRLQCERMHIQMIQTEKMASLGRLVNGVSHEILDPVGFIWGNLCHVSDYTQDLIQLIQRYEEQLVPLPPPLQELREEVELDYLCHDLPKAIASIQSGADRLKKLATSLQTFCYIDEVYPKPADIHRCLDSIVFLLETKLSGAINVVRHYGNLPPITCYIGQLNQVFTNIISNAVNALLDQQESPLPSDDESATDSGDRVSTHQSCITITTQVWTQHFEDDVPSPPLQSPRPKPPSSTIFPQNKQPTATPALCQHRWVSIQIANNGPELSPEQLQAIHHALANHHPAEKETSLSLSYRIVTEKHNGKLLVRSPIEWAADHDDASSSSPSSQPSTNRSETPQQGTEFQILLPIQ
ncbi:MAG: sensor histidine kinase [Symploca sp. SIO2B6]|nr:sensor histidine kinase [Symploca sp. SIO2B6]